MFVYIDGRYVEESEAVISVFDHGLVTGDGAFETIGVYDNMPFAITRHLERLSRTVQGMRLGAPNLTVLAEAIYGLLERNSIGEGKLRITYTAGNAGLGSGRVGGDPRVVMALESFAFQTASSPTKVVRSPWPRNERGVLAGLKTTSYAENVVALDYAQSLGGTEVIFGNIAGNLCEGSGSNIFYVVDGALHTPPLSSGCLAGVTRDLIVEKLGAKETDISFDALVDGTISEAFITSSLREIQPIAFVDTYRMKEVDGEISRETYANFVELRRSNPNP